ncbi:MAG: efflux RND transporter periplasmic adaptor subunit [Polyangiaceae bacterium]|nr:efflux RND transporter periplasmic adaptor subunit [Polyangiaceae bacterium]
MPSRWLARSVGVSVMVLVGSMLSSCEREVARTERGPRVVPVVVTEVVEKAVPVEVCAVGSTTPHRTVEIVAQVNGQVRGEHFVEGQPVKAGDLLFTIDTRAYESALGAARANLARAESLVKQARAEEARYRTLAEQGLASQQDYDQARAEAEALEAALHADRAAVSGAAVDIGFTRIRAPIDGRTGTLLVRAGSVVRADGSPMVVIRQTKPLDVRFAVPERYLAAIRPRLARGEVVDVMAWPLGDPKHPVRGHVTFMENTVTSATGTIDLKAELPNLDEALWPGQLVDVALRLGVDDKALVVPEAAVQPGQDGDHAYVVVGGAAELRKVRVLRQVAAEFVVEGLAKGEKVVVDGQIRLAPGSRVEIQSPATGGKP